MQPDHEDDWLESLLRDEYGAQPLDKQLSAELVERLQMETSTASPPRQHRLLLALCLGTVAAAATILSPLWMATSSESQQDTHIAQRSESVPAGNSNEIEEFRKSADRPPESRLLAENREEPGAGGTEIGKVAEYYKSPPKGIHQPQTPGASNDDKLPGADMTEYKKDKRKSEQSGGELADADIRELTHDTATRQGWKIVVEDKENDGYVRFTVQPPAALLSQGRTAFLSVWHERKLITSTIAGLHRRKQGSRYEFAVSNQYLAGATFELGSVGILEGSESYRMHLHKFVSRP